MSDSGRNRSSNNLVAPQGCLTGVMQGTRGRPRQFDVQQVLDKTVDLFWRNGYAETTTRDLESALGISQSSLYNAFGSKRDLMDAAMGRYEERVGQELLAPLESGDGGLDAIGAFFDSLANIVTSDGRAGCMIINLTADDGGADGKLGARAAAYRSRIRAALRAALEGAVDSGDASPGHVDERVDLLYGVTLGVNLLARDRARRSEVFDVVAGTHTLLTGWRA